MSSQQVFVSGFLTLFVAACAHQVTTPTNRVAAKEKHPIDTPLAFPMPPSPSLQSAPPNSFHSRRQHQFNQQFPREHPDYNAKFYLFDVILERPSAGQDTTYEVLNSIFTIFQSMGINNLLPGDAFKVVGKPHVILTVKGNPGAQDIASSVERVVRSLEVLGTKVDVTLLYSLEAFVESIASKIMPLSALVGSTRSPIPEIGYPNLYLCRLTFLGTDMDKLTYVSQTLNVTLEMLEMRAEGRLNFRGHRISGTQPFEFQFYIHQQPALNEYGALGAIPLFNAGNVRMQTEEVQPLGHVLDVMSNTQAVNIVQM